MDTKRLDNAALVARKMVNRHNSSMRQFKQAEMIARPCNSCCAGGGAEIEWNGAIAYNLNSEGEIAGAIMAFVAMARVLYKQRISTYTEAEVVQAVEVKAIDLPESAYDPAKPGTHVLSANEAAEAVGRALVAARRPVSYRRLMNNNEA